MVNGTAQSSTSVPTINEPALVPVSYEDHQQKAQPPPPQELSAAPVIQQSYAPASDPITRAQQEASTSTAESDEMVRNIQIRDQPIQEDESEAQLAMSNMANQLKLQAQSSGMGRTSGTVRGRRDVRNTMFVPSSSDAPSAPGATNSMFPSTPSTVGAPIAAAPAPVTSSDSISDLPSPIHRLGTPGTMQGERNPGSDTQSMHSSRSLANIVHHPDLHEPGLNASIVETVSTWFEGSEITKSSIIGEIGLAYNPPNTGTIENETIRLHNFQVLGKVAANPTFVSQVPATGDKEEQSGIYTVAVTSIRRPTPTVGFKYQLHIDESNLGQYSPILIQPAWQIVEGQASVIVLYSRNPAFALGQQDVALRNVTITVHLELNEGAGRPSSAMMAPTQGASFRRKAGAVVWRFNEMTLKSEQERLLARFMIQGGLAKRGNIEVKFEAPGRIGSGLGLQKAIDNATKEVDPFADEGEGSVASLGGERKWDDLEVRKMLVSGRYTAS